MKYNIHFNNNSINKNILATLIKLNNIFFIENLSFDSKKNILDNKVFFNNFDIKNLKKNFNEMHLSNFEFIKNSDNFIENKVYNNLK